MKTKKNNLLISFLAVLLNLQGIFSQSVTVSYENFVANILAYHPLAKKAANTKEYGRLQNLAAAGNYDPQISGTYANKFYDGSNYYSSAGAEVKQALFTSQYLKVGYDYGMGANVNPELITPSGGLPFMGLEVGVLQGLQIDKRRADVLKSREYLKYYDADQKVQLNNLLYESSQSYFNWLYSSREIALNNYFMQLAYERLMGIEALATIGEKAAVDTIEAAIFYQTRLLDLQNALIENQQHANGLSAYNWQKEGAPALGTKIIPADSLDVYYSRSKDLLTLMMQEDPETNPILSKYGSLQEVLDIDKRLKKEMIKPVLNVNYNFLSMSNTGADRAFSTNNYKWGVNMAFPLFLRNPANEYKMAKVVSQNNQLELKDKQNELRFKVNALKQNLSLLSQQLLNAERSARYSKQLVEAEKLKFENGESSLFMLNTREYKLLEAELKLAEYKLKFIKNILGLIYLKGSLDYRI